MFRFQCQGCGKTMQVVKLHAGNFINAAKKRDGTMPSSNVGYSAVLP